MIDVYLKEQEAVAYTHLDVYKRQILDAVILFIYFKFEKKNFPAKAQKYFMPFTILAVVSCFVMQFAFYFHFRGIPAAQYSAFAQNAAMSILFLTALYTRNTTKGQSMLDVYKRQP